MDRHDEEKIMPQTNHGSIEFLKFPDPQHPGDTTRMIKKWLRDSWARRKIAALQTAISGTQSALNATQMAAVNSGITAAQLQSILDRLHALDGQ